MLTLEFTFIGLPPIMKAIMRILQQAALAGIVLGMVPGVQAKTDDPQFPVRPSANGRYLVDAAGKPFLYHADTAWMLFLRLTPAEADEYFTVRKSQGFTTVQVQLTGFLGMTNTAGQRPFQGNHDLARPNEAFFAQVDAIIDLAARHKLLLAVAPLWAGCCGEGWAGRNKDGSPKPMNACGPEVCHDLGRWLGQRYARYPHLLWILGGDNDPQESREVIRQLALGLKQTAPHQLLTYHAASSHSSTDAWPDDTWIDVPMVYTYFRGFNKAWNKNQPDVYEVGYREYSKSPARPFFLGESTYEGEHDAWGSPRQARKQAYWAMLSGATGHAYGSPNWRCEAGWRDGLQRPGARSLQHFYHCFSTRAWWTLAPDLNNEVAIAGRGPYATNNYATTAIAADRSFAITYLPSPRSVTIDLSRFSGSRVNALWFDPRSGQTTRIKRFKTAGQETFHPPSQNPEEDWVLVLERPHSANKF
jgi:hypothetical protein